MEILDVVKHNGRCSFQYIIRLALTQGSSTVERLLKWIVADRRRVDCAIQFHVENEDKPLPAKIRSMVQEAIVANREATQDDDNDDEGDNDN